MRYAHVRNGICTNVSRWDREPTPEERESYAPEELVDVTGLGVGPDWRYIDGEWLESEPS
jgi:hypothetical protein